MRWIQTIPFIRLVLVPLALVVPSAASALSAGALVAIGFPASGPAGIYSVDLDTVEAQALAALPAPGYTGYRHVAAEPSGTVLVAGTAGVQRLDPSTGVYTPLSSEAVSFIDVANDGSIYVASGTTLDRLDPATGIRTPVYSDAANLRGLAAGVAGALITARHVPASDPLTPELTERREILSIDLASSAVTVLSATGSAFFNPFIGEYYRSGTGGVQATPDGTVFVAIGFSTVVGEGGSISSTTPGTPSYAWGEFDSAGGFAIDASGRLIVSIADFGSVDLRRNTWSGSNVSEPFDFSGSGIDVFNSLDFVPIPEPGSMILLGIGLAAIARRSVRGS